jgi:Uma2 family endonuclease
MSTGTLISVAEYLATAYRPDRDYLEGEVRERNLGEYDHARLQSKLMLYFGNREDQLGVIGIVEQRVQVRPNRFRVPDFCLLRANATPEQIVRTAPLLAVEVLSPDDRLTEMQDRVDDYIAMGVPVVWVVDPKKRRAWIHTQSGIEEARGGELPGPGFAIPFQSLFDT